MAKLSQKGLVLANIGIDLGTTNSSVSVFKDGEPIVIKNNLGRELTPSIISIGDDGEIIVGDTAKNRLVSHPSLTISVFKPFMGSNKKFSLGDHSWRPEQLSAFILKALKQDAQNFLGDEVIDNVVISVPAYFNNTQRKAVENAAGIAGIKVACLICEPTAAALTFGFEKKNYSANFIVLDIGGGTFDVTLIEVFNGIFEIKASAGNNKLGGEDFTDKILADFYKTCQVEESRVNPKIRASIREKCEHLKRSLSNFETASFEVQINGNDYSYSLTNSKFSQIANELLQGIQDPVIRVLKDTKTGLDEIDNVVIVGGSSRLKIFKDLVDSFFPDSEIVGYDPDLAISKGAAIKSHLHGTSSKVKEYVVTDVTPFTLGQSVYSRQLDKVVYMPIIERNTPVPISKTKTTYKSEGQDSISIEIFQGESLDPKKNHYLGEIKLSIPHMEELPIVTQFTFDINGILHVDVSIEEKGIHESLVIRNGDVDLSDIDLEKYKKEIQELKILPRDKADNKLLISKLERIYEESVGSSREHVQSILEGFVSRLNAGNPIEIEKFTINVKQFLSKFFFDGDLH